MGLRKLMLIHERISSNAKLARLPRLGMESPCLEWTACKDRDGYGRITVDGVSKSSHRVAWELVHGCVPVGLLVLHRCDNPACVLVAHMFVGTEADNARDKVSKGRSCIGTKNASAKLREEDVSLVFRMRKNGMRQRDIAGKLGIVQSTASLILHRKLWAHVAIEER